MKNLKKTCENIVFGIELESCYHVVGKTDNEKKDVNVKYEQSKIDNKHTIFDCFSKKSRLYEDPNFIWRYCLPTDQKCTGDYDNWILTTDATVYCGSALSIDIYAFEKKQKTDNIPSLQFYPIEMVSPKLGMRQNYSTSGDGLRNIALTFEGWIYDDNIVYTVNDSQGLHVNLSHQDANINEYTPNFVYLWYLFEEFFINMVTGDRRSLNEEWFLTNKYSNIKDIDLSKLVEKSTVLKIHPTRIEVRAFDGTVVMEDVYMITLLCILFLGVAVDITKESIINLMKPVDFQTRIGQLFSLIQDINVIKFCVKTYNINKDKNSPIIPDYKGPNTVLFPIYKITEKDRLFITPAITVSC